MCTKSGNFPFLCAPNFIFLSYQLWRISESQSEREWEGGEQRIERHTCTERERSRSRSSFFPYTLCIWNNNRQTVIKNRRPLCNNIAISCCRTNWFNQILFCFASHTFATKLFFSNYCRAGVLVLSPCIRMCVWVYHNVGQTYAHHSDKSIFQQTRRYFDMDEWYTQSVVCEKKTFFLSRHPQFRRYLCCNLLLLFYLLLRVLHSIFHDADVGIVMKFIRLHSH